MNRSRLIAWVLTTLAAVLAGSGRAQGDLLINGDFESGSLSGWTVANQLSSTDYAGGTDANGSFYLQNNSGGLPVSGPLTGGSALAPYSGSYYALSDSTAPGVHALLQSFTVPVGTTSVTLSFAMYTFDWYGAGATGGTSLDYISAPNQHVQVDILSATAGAFDTGSGVVSNLYNGEIPQPASGDPSWETFSYNLTGLTLPGGTYQLRFAEVDNQFTLNMGLDAVSVSARSVPEPSSLLLVSIGGFAAVLGLRRSKD